MKRKHIIHVRLLNGENVRVEADTFDGAIARLNCVTNGRKYDIGSMEHILGGEVEPTKASLYKDLFQPETNEGRLDYLFR